MDGVIPYGLGMVLVVSSITVVVVALLVTFTTLLRSTRSLHGHRSRAQMCDPSEVPSPAEVDEFVRSLTPEDFAVAERFAADFRGASRRSDS
jgi:hypothetical protein